MTSQGRNRRMTWCVSPRARAEAGGGLLHLGSEVGHLLHLPDFDDLVVGRGAARGPLDRLGLRLHLNHPVAAEHLVHPGKRPLGDLGLGCRPSSASSTPAFSSASLYFIMVSTCFGSGMAPGAAAP